MTIPNSTYRGVGNSHCFGQCVTTFSAVQNFLDLRITQFVIAVPFALGDRSMANGVLRICSRVTVVEIIRHIIFTVAIFVANHRTDFWTRPNKSRSNNTMNRLAVYTPTNAQRHLQPSGTIYRLLKHLGCATAAINAYATDLRGIRNLVRGGFWNDFPYDIHSNGYGMKPMTRQRGLT